MGASISVWQLEVGVWAGGVGQTHGDRGVDIPGPSLGQAAIKRCRVAATLYFTTGDSRYRWLEGAQAVWEGELKEATHHARYTAFLQLTALAG